MHTEIEDQAAKCTELTKKKLPSQMKDSTIARTAVYQWNKLNTAVRIFVHKTTVILHSNNIIACPVSFGWLYKSLPILIRITAVLLIGWHAMMPGDYNGRSIAESTAKGNNCQ